MSAPTITRVSGPLVEIDGAGPARLRDLVELGPQRLAGEIISLQGDVAVVQAHEYTGGLGPGDPAWLGDGPLTAEFGPGLLGGVYDGMLRRLSVLGERLVRGAHAATLSADRHWSFAPSVAPGDRVCRGAVIGSVPETVAITARALVPPDIQGAVEWIADAGEHTIAEPIAIVGGQEIRLAHPGGFGTGKTVLLQQIAKWSDADVIVFVLWRARQRTLGRAGRDLHTRGSAYGAAASRPHRARGQHVEHAVDGAGGQRLRRCHRRRALPRHGL
jgi:V/A-type H+-transporting ATPase subunit A